MSRKDFLREIGLALLSLVGINAMISSLLRQNRHWQAPPPPPAPPTTSKFGGGKYGI